MALATLAATCSVKIAHAQTQPAPQKEVETTDDYNRRLEQLRRLVAPQAAAGGAEEYRIGPEDLLEIAVFEAPEMNRILRVSAGGEISLPLLGAVRCGSLTPHELELVLQELLHRSYMKDPHVTVFVREVQSHAVSVFGAVRKPGVYQIRGAKSLVEVLSMAEGLAEDAGDTALVIHRGAAGSAPPTNEADANASSIPGATTEKTQQAAPAVSGTSEAGGIEINLKSLLQSGDPVWNIPVYPGDVVKVTRAGVVYVVGEVKKPGGYLLKNNENISVLQAIALAEGLTRTSARGHARIIRTDEQSGKRTEIAVDLGKILAGKAEDPSLRPRDIVFVPNSAARGGFYRGAEAAVGIVSGLLVFRR